ncbi:MAG: hypothetical protein E7664_03400 [Ruminococcaceae bacterium]|nr:hypothetical protein [Oscillospiraceae bacterium]
MTVRQVCDALALRPVAMPNPDREVTGGYAGDLLSWVMSRAEEGDAWITIMSNVNTLAVATLTDPACIILAEGVSPDEGVAERAEQQGINLLCSQLPAFALCAAVSELL